MRGRGIDRLREARDHDVMRFSGSMMSDESPEVKRAVAVMTPR